MEQRKKRGKYLLKYLQQNIVANKFTEVKKSTQKCDSFGAKSKSDVSGFKKFVMFNLHFEKNYKQAPWPSLMPIDNVN